MNGRPLLSFRAKSRNLSFEEFAAVRDVSTSLDMTKSDLGNSPGKSGPFSLWEKVRMRASMPDVSENGAGGAERHRREA
jgi:hypothetical protein